MNPRNKLSILLFLSFSALAQSPADDDVKLKSAFDWLDSKLNYLYYDNSGERWWNNTFYVNEANEVTIKHIVSDRPNTANIREKTYTIRKFKIEDINPKSLKITEIEESRGRLVKGQMLELRTYGFQDLIHKSINNRRASSTSFLFLSFPESLIDSLTNYADIVKSKFEEAILASTQVYATDNTNDKQVIFDVLTGEYETSDGMIWSAQQIETNVLKVDRGNKLTEFFGFDPKTQKFYFLTISAQGIVRKDLDFIENTKILLSSDDGLEIVISTPHAFAFGPISYFRK